MRMQNLTPPLFTINFNAVLDQTLIESLYLWPLSIFFIFYYLFLIWMENYHTPILHANVGLGPYITVTHAIPRFSKEFINSHYFLVEKLDQNGNFECIFLYGCWKWISRNLWFWVAGKDESFSYFNLEVFLPLPPLCFCFCFVMFLSLFIVIARNFLMWSWIMLHAIVKTLTSPIIIRSLFGHF